VQEIPAALVAMTGIVKSFGPVRALDGVDLRVGVAEAVGIVGHNGAGKSTLISILRGTVRRDGGDVRIGGTSVSIVYDVGEARKLGIRSVFQEPALCPTLTVVENTRLVHRSLRGWGWAQRARRVIGNALDNIFPGHDISLDAVVGELLPGPRQMVEIARAFSVSSSSPRLVILDEPTSALDAKVAEQFLTFIDKARHHGVACVLISHRLKEIIDHTERVVIMRDGRIVDEKPSAEVSPEDLVEAMGVMAQSQEGPRSEWTSGFSDRRERAVPPQRRISQREDAEIHFTAAAGEVVGLAGLAGHGQREQLLAVFAAGERQISTVEVWGRTAYVSGDRYHEGMFPLWSITRNLTIGLMGPLARFGVIDTRAESETARLWRNQLNIKTPEVALPILSLSGGNQQKVLIARALASGADILLLDDPMRGVDVGSKREMFAWIQKEAAEGKCFLIYTTEIEELEYCTRVYVFYQGKITDEIGHAEFSEDRVLAASFGHSRRGV
jgi:ribose transport system ATP-binding protein